MWGSPIRRNKNSVRYCKPKKLNPLHYVRRRIEPFRSSIQVIYFRNLDSFRHLNLYVFSNSEKRAWDSSSLVSSQVRSKRIRKLHDSSQRAFCNRLITHVCTFINSDDAATTCTAQTEISIFACRVHGLFIGWSSSLCFCCFFTALNSMQQRLQCSRVRRSALK